MLRQVLITLAMVLLPYVIYGVVEAIRRRRLMRSAESEVVEVGFWSRAPIFALGIAGCLLAVAVLIAVAVIDTNPNTPRYVPPIVVGND